MCFYVFNCIFCFLYLSDILFMCVFVCFYRLSSATEELALTQQNLQTKEALADDLDAKIQTSQQSTERKSEWVRRITRNKKNLSPIDQSINQSLSVCLSPSPAASCCSVRNSLSSSFITPSNHCAAPRPASPPRKPCWTPRWPLLPPRPHPRLPLRCRTRTTLALSDPL